MWTLFYRAASYTHPKDDDHVVLPNLILCEEEYAVVGRLAQRKWGVNPTSMRVPFYEARGDTLDEVIEWHRTGHSLVGPFADVTHLLAEVAACGGFLEVEP